MLDNLLHNHNRTVVDEDGHLRTVKATCAEVNNLIGSHVGYDEVPAADGSGDTEVIAYIASCADTDAVLAALRTTNGELATENKQLGSRVATLVSEAADKDGMIANYERLMKLSMVIVFRLGAALQKLGAVDLGNPDLTDDGTAVKVENVQFTIIIEPFAERITVRDVTGVVPERTFAVVDGRINEDAQTLFLGQIDRIRKAAVEGGADPVNGQIGLVRQTADSAAA